MVKKVKATLVKEMVLADDCNETRELYNSSRYGEPVDGRFQYSLVEALFLFETNKLLLYDYRKKKLDFKSFLARVVKIDSGFLVRYNVYKDLRKRGYIVKTALKFGAGFRVYDRGVKPGDDHARWVVFPVHEADHFTWYEFAAKNRVAHSTRKKLLLGVVDDEGDVSYWESSWVKP